jgi:HSP20 family protein
LAAARNTPCGALPAHLNDEKDIAMLLRLHTNHDPWREFRTLQRQMDDVFRGLLSGPSRPSWTTAFGPAFNVAETDQAYVIEAELPGVKQEDLNVEATENSVTIKGKRSAAVPEGHATHRRERGDGTFARSFGFENRLDLEQVKATLKDGLLHLELVKQAVARPRQIAIQAARKDA